MSVVSSQSLLRNADIETKRRQRLISDAGICVEEFPGARILRRKTNRRRTRSIAPTGGLRLPRGHGGNTDTRKTWPSAEIVIQTVIGLVNEEIEVELFVDV